jgi:two-component system LytT family response regulator
MINAVIIEDSRLARQELKELLKQHPDIAIVGEADTAAQALELVRLVHPDLIFLDIHLPGQNGFELLQQLEKVPPVIFTTAFDQYALQAFEHNTLDYLLKPIVPDRLALAIAKAMTHFRAGGTEPGRERLKEDSQIFVRDGHKCWFVNLMDIRLLESRGNYTQLYFQHNGPLILKTLQQLESMLDEKQFQRVNRQQIVNVRYITQVADAPGNRLKLTLGTGELIEVSRRQVQKFREMFRF